MHCEWRQSLLRGDTLEHGFAYYIARRPDVRSRCLHLIVHNHGSLVVRSETRPVKVQKSVFGLRPVAEKIWSQPICVCLPWVLKPIVYHFPLLEIWFIRTPVKRRFEEGSNLTMLSTQGRRGFFGINSCLRIKRNYYSKNRRSCTLPRTCQNIAKALNWNVKSFELDLVWRLCTKMGDLVEKATPEEG